MHYRRLWAGPFGLHSLEFCIVSRWICVFIVNMTSRAYASVAGQSHLIVVVMEAIIRTIINLTYMYLLKESWKLF